MQLIDMTGWKCHELRVVSRCKVAKGHNAYWLCMCSCGNPTVVRSDNLLSGKTKSCGCLRRRKKK